MASGAAIASGGSRSRPGSARHSAPRTGSKSPGSTRARSFKHHEPSETTSLLGSEDPRDGLWDSFWPSREELHHALTEPQTPVALAFFFLVVLAIIGSILAFILESMAAYEHWHGWKEIEVAVVILFTAEVGLRWWCHPGNNVSFFSEPLTIVDVASIIPFYLDLLVFDGTGPDLRWLRVLRLVNLFKVGRHSAGLQFMFRAVMRSIAGLALLAFLLFQALMVFSTIMWLIERGAWNAQLHCYARFDGRCSPFQSIAHAAWWGITTMTTVGYGDSIPITTTGRYFGAIAMLGGIIMLALPTTVFGSQFAEEYNAMKLDEASHRVLAEDKDAAGQEELLTLRAELLRIRDEVSELLPAAHSRVQSLVEKEGRGYVFARNGVMLRDAVAALQDFTKLVEEWSEAPITPSYGSLASSPVALSSPPAFVPGHVIQHPLPSPPDLSPPDSSPGGRTPV